MRNVEIAGDILSVESPKSIRGIALSLKLLGSVVLEKFDMNHVTQAPRWCNFWGPRRINQSISRNPNSAKIGDRVLVCALQTVPVSLPTNTVDTEVASDADATVYQQRSRFGKSHSLRASCFGHGF